MNSTVNAPILRTPLTDFVTTFGKLNVQKYGSPQCKRFELQYLDCMEAYGVEKGYINCKEVFEDFYECRHGVKQEWRYQQLRAERLKQIKEGKLEKKFIDTPEPEIMYEIRL